MPLTRPTADSAAPMTVLRHGMAGRLVAVVVTHQRLAKLQVTLDRLLAEPADLLAGVVVFDNASADGTADWLRSLSDPRLVIKINAENIGGAGGFEQGLKLAAATFDADWYVLMDDDARPATGALPAFHAARLDGWAAVAAAVYYPDGSICEMNRPSLNPFWHFRAALRTLVLGRGGFHIGPGAYEGPPIQIDVTSFVGFFISRQTLERVGLPDGRLFLYGDDGLYTLAMSKAGGRIGFLPEIRFEHDCSTLSDGAGGRFSPLWKVYYYHRNLLELYRMAAGPWFWLVLVVILPKWLGKVRHHGGERRAFLRLMRQAVLDGLRLRRRQDHARILAMAGPTPAR